MDVAGAITSDQRTCGVLSDKKNRASVRTDGSRWSLSGAGINTTDMTMADYTFERSEKRPTKAAPVGEHAELADAVIATASTGGSISVTPTSGASAAKMMGTLRNAISNRLKRRKIHLKTRVILEGERIFMWCEPMTAATLPVTPAASRPVDRKTAQPVEMSPLERRIVSALSTASVSIDEGFSVAEIGRFCFGAQASKHEREVREALSALSARRLLMVDADDHYSMAAGRRA